METLKEKYGDYIFPALCFVTGMLTGLLLGTLLSSVKGGRITLFSNNMIGSKNGSENRAEDMMVGAQKSKTEKGN